MPDDRPILFSAPMVQALLAGRKTQTRRLAWRVPPYQRRFDDPSAGMTEGTPSPWYSLRPGIRLWVREAFTTTQYGKAVYCADARDQTGQRWGSITPGDPDREVRWKPSIHMPRRLSRLTLLVTDVRVQRLRDITEADAMAEGVEPVLVPPDGGSCPHVFGFLNLWDQLHGPGGWEANPEVVALTFTVQQRNIDA